MSATKSQRDVIFLVADRNMEASVQGLLTRSKSLAIRPIDSVIRVHPEKDPGCYRRAHDFLRPFHNRYAYAIVIFDREDCGKENESRETLEAEVEDRLKSVGWSNRAKVIVIDPELESWVWSDSPEVDAALGWANKTPALRTWLAEQGFLTKDTVKPPRPKEAVEAALLSAREPRSSAIYRKLAENVSLRRCTDPAFQKLRATLQEWFSV